jgi:hypothetical protein
MCSRSRVSEREREYKRHIETLEEQLQQQYDFGVELTDYADDAHAMIERWCEAFDMEQDDSGRWHMPDSVFVRYDQLLENHRKLTRDWNRFVDQYNSVIAPRTRNFGRPLAASPAQQANVLARRKQGQSLRFIAEATNLSLRTVRTVIDKKDGVDRATLARLERLAPDKIKEARERAGRNMRASVPKQAGTLLEEGEKLLKRAKGLGAGT